MGPYRAKWREHLFKKQNGRCYYCGEPMNLARKANGQPGRGFVTLEHLERIVDGGKTNASNVVLAELNKGRAEIEAWSESHT